MKKAMILVVALMGLSACGAPQSAFENKTDTLRYTYDSRTNLCFGWSTNSYGAIATNVPCTVEVLQLTGERIREPVEPVRNDGLRP